MAVDPKGADLKRLLAEEAGEPVVMLNLRCTRAAARQRSLPRTVRRGTR
ncbi:hypothetical protein [Streptomyces anandii]|nr:hypothetical protein [Streptomyces anandii]